MNFPDHLKYTADHEWVLIEGNDATVGITDFAQGELGDIVYIEIETKGDALTHETVFGTVEAVKTVSDLFMPVTGTVSEINPDLDGNPELVNTDPYGKGWLIKIKMESGADTSHLLDVESYKKLIGH
jgi:glycine cleavage system H protein